jgi:DNA (cytosine-5)-methyltransferase 1
MIFGSVCSGIEAASVAWEPMGWRAAFLSEIEPFPRAILEHHYPDVPLRGDFREIQGADHEAIDLLVGGTPCQSFSLAGLRGGLGDDRGNLALEYLRLVDRLRPRWWVWENVPGVLSSGRGRDFGAFLGALGELGYGWAYRVLDAQFVRVGRWPRAVPQRRRRVFVVGCLGDWTAAAEAVLIPEGMRRYIEASGKTRKNATADAEGGVARCVTTGEMKRQDYETCTMVAQPTAGTLGNRGLRSHTELDGHGAYIPVAQPVPYDLFQITAPVNRQNRKPGDPCHTLARDNAAHAAVASTMTVRRLSARECERLQGFPDDWTLIPWRGKPAEQCPDGPRYKALGNSMACNCMAWIGERIASHEAETRVD